MKKREDSRLEQTKVKEREQWQGEHAPAAPASALAFAASLAFARSISRSTAPLATAPPGDGDGTDGAVQNAVAAAERESAFGEAGPCCDAANADAGNTATAAAAAAAASASDGSSAACDSKAPTSFCSAFSTAESSMTTRYCWLLVFPRTTPLIARRYLQHTKLWLEGR
jgi:hypothetical protein